MKIKSALRNAVTTTAPLLVMLLVAQASLPVAVHAQVPGNINYQGRIVDNGTNFNGTGQFEFALVNPGGGTNYWSNDGTPVGQPANAVSLTVTKGLYSVLLGNMAVSNMTVAISASVFANSNVLLRVWFNDGINGFQQLSPDQQLGAAGYALQAQNAAMAATANGTSPTGLIQGSVLNIGSGNVVSGQYASVAGGATNTAGGPYAFVGGGTGNQASGTNAIVGGGSGNVAEGDFSVVVGGLGNIINIPPFNPCYIGLIGANYDYIGGGQINSISSITKWGAIVGGYNNIIGAFCNFSFIGGGDQNDIDCYSSESTISGGTSNNVQYSSSDSTIGGGAYNTIQTNTVYATIGGGVTNTIQYGASSSIIGGGAKNTIYTNAIYATIAGGQGNFAGEHHVSIGGGLNNTIQTNSYDATIGGGSSNTVQSGAYGATVGGGLNNTIQTNSYDATIGGGNSNIIQSNTFGSTIGGGAFNTIQDGAESSAIAGGAANIIQFNADKSAIGGGYDNHIWSNAGGSVIGGGIGNAIQSNADDSTIGGGAGNSVQPFSPDSTIGGGGNNSIQSNAFASTIGGGAQNMILPGAGGSTIGGGIQNVISTPAYAVTNVPPAYGTIGGGAGNVISNTEYATIPGGQQAQATNYAQMAYSSGSFSTAGDGQFSLYVLRGVSCSTNATLYLDYPTSTQEIVLPADRACAYTISIVGRESGSVGGFGTTYWMRGVANGKTALVENDGANNGAGDLGCTPAGQVTVSGGKMHLQVININCASNCTRWVATVQTAEVSYP